MSPVHGEPSIGRHSMPTSSVRKKQENGGNIINYNNNCSLFRKDRN